MRTLTCLWIFAISLPNAALWAQDGRSSSTATPLSLNQLEGEANAAYAAKHYAEAAKLSGQAANLAQGSERVNIEYNEACSLALGGEKESAFAVLSQAVDDGFEDRSQLEGDADLISLHGEAQWKVLLERADSLKKMQDARWGMGAFKTSYAENLSDTDKVAGLSELWAEAKFGFANFWHVPQLDWDATYKSFLPQVLATKSTAEYYKVLQHFYAQLEDGHTSVSGPKELRQYWLPLETRLIDGRIIVTGSLDSKFDMQGVKPGDEVLQVNGMPVQLYAEKNVQPYVTASSPQDRIARTFGWSLFLSREGTVFHLTLQTPDHHEFVRVFTSPGKYYGPESAFEFRMLPGNIAYVALNEFGDNKDAEEWDKHWPEISQAEALIIDMRKNGGGNDTVGAHVLATLIDRPVSGTRQESPEWIATSRAWGQAQPMMHYPEGEITPESGRHFGGKVVMLTGPDTYSAAEDMVVLFAQSKRGVLVGEPTGGSTGQPLSFRLPGGGSAQVCSKHDSFADGREFVGVGVAPDVSIHVAREDLIHRIDSVLDMGVSVAMKH